MYQNPIYLVGTGGDLEVAVNWGVVFDVSSDYLNNALSARSTVMLNLWAEIPGV